MDQIDTIDALAKRLPEHAWTMRRLRRQDEEFRALCDDYGEALAALEHWQQACGPTHARVREYRQLAAELAEEVLTYVEAQGRR